MVTQCSFSTSKRKCRSFLYEKKWIHIFLSVWHQGSFLWKRHESTFSHHSHINALFLFYVKGMKPHFPPSLTSMLFFFCLWKAWIYIPPVSHQCSFSFLCDRHESTFSLLFFLKRNESILSPQPHNKSRSFPFYLESKHYFTYPFRPHIRFFFGGGVKWRMTWIYILPSDSYYCYSSFLFIGKGMKLNVPTSHQLMIFFFSFLWWKAWIQCYFSYLLLGKGINPSLPSSLTSMIFFLAFLCERHETTSSLQPPINDLFLYLSLWKARNYISPQATK